MWQDTIAALAGRIINRKLDKIDDHKVKHAIKNNGLDVNDIQTKLNGITQLDNSGLGDLESFIRGKRIGDFAKHRQHLPQDTANETEKFYDNAMSVLVEYRKSLNVRPRPSI